MNITKNNLKQLIKEELASLQAEDPEGVFDDVDYSEGDGSGPEAYAREARENTRRLIKGQQAMYALLSNISTDLQTMISHLGIRRM